MKIIYTLRGTNYNDDIEYTFDGETITAKYITNGKIDEESTTQEDTFDLSVIEEGDKFEGIETDLPIDVIVDAYRENGELYVKLAWMPLKSKERKEKFGVEKRYITEDLYTEYAPYRVNVMEYEVV